MRLRTGNLNRREFLIQGSTAAAGVASARALAQAGPQAATMGRRVVHVIGHSHIDAAWLWPWRDGADAVLNTFRSALNRMRDHPGFCYTHSSSQHYRWVERADPAMFAEILTRIREGRWEVVGAWPVEPDCNIPATESFVRHALYGKQFCRQTLGVDVRIGFNPDSFGHAAGLPTVLRHTGYDHYVFMRPQEHEMELPLLFWWQAPDGSRVLTLRIWKEYDGNAAGLEEAIPHLFAPGMDHAAFFLGVGDHGGAVTEAQVQAVTALQQDSSLPELRWSTLQQFFTAVRASRAFDRVPVIATELQHHSRGCYSAYGEGKYLNRRAERALVQTESISLMTAIAAGRSYPAAEISATWWRVLFCQFHDMLAGTSLYADYQDVRDSVGSACDTALSHKVEALEAMATRVDLSRVKESAVIAYNSLPWPRKALLEFHIEQDPDHHGLITHLQPETGAGVPIQFRPPDSMTNYMPRLCAWVDLPACGYRVFELGHGSAPAGAGYLSRVSASQTGFGISSLRAQNGAELLAAPIGLVALSDTADTWAHDVRQFRQEMGRPMLVSAGVVEEGPVLRITRHRATWLNSEIVLDIVEYAGINAVELRFVIDWREHQQMLKLEIPTALTGAKLFAKVPGAVIERSTNGEEEPYQDWAAVEGRVGQETYTVALLNSGTYSYDCLGGLFRTVLIRSAPFARHQPSPVTYFDTNAWQDQGRQERRFWLVAGAGAYTQLALDRLAEEVQTAAEYVVSSAHSGTEPWARSFLEVQPQNIWVLALKSAEKLPASPASAEVILRVQERSGVATRASVRSELMHLDHTIDLKPWELKTLRIRRPGSAAAEMTEVSGLEA